MFKKLKLAYVAVFYKLCMFVVSFVQKIMLHLIKIQGLDPTRNVEAEQHKELYEALSREFTENPKRGIAKIQVDVTAGRNDVPHRAFKIKHLFPHNAVPDYSVAPCKFVHEKDVKSALQVVNSLDTSVEVAVPSVEVVPEPVTEVIPEVADEDILESTPIVEEVVVPEVSVEPAPIKRRRARTKKIEVKNLVQKSIKKTLKNSKKR